MDSSQESIIVDFVDKALDQILTASGDDPEKVYDVALRTRYMIRGFCKASEIYRDQLAEKDAEIKRLKSGTNGKPHDLQRV